jgi:hypothetical protein
MDTMTEEKAREFARQYLAEVGNESEIDISVLEQYVFGWVVYYNTKKYIETGDEHYALEGNSPLLVSADGKVRPLCDSMTEPDVAIDRLIDLWEKRSG